MMNGLSLSIVQILILNFWMMCLLVILNCY